MRISRFRTTGSLLADNWQWLVLWVGCVLSALYARPPIPVDETRYLSVAWEMWQSNQFLVPHLNGVPYSQKPPLLFWAIHFFWWLFGVGEWQARLVPPLFGLVSVALTVRLARMLWPKDRDVAVISPFVLLGLSVWTIFSSLTMFDTLLTSCCLIVLWALLVAERNWTVKPWLAVGLFLGLGMLAKGPVALLYVVPPMLLAPWWSERRGGFWRWWYGWGLASLALALVIALSWAIPAAIQGGTQYGQDILFSQTSGRIVRSFAHRQPFYWYLLILPLLFFPWILWRPVWRGRAGFFHDPANRFCLAVIVPSLLLLSCISGKQLHYVMPLLPLFALSLARMATRAPQVETIEQRPVAVPLILVGIALLVVMQSPLGREGGWLAFLPDWLGLIPLLCAVPVLLIRAPFLVRSAKMVATSYLLFSICVHLALTDPLHEKFQPEGIGESLHAIQQDSRRIAVFPGKLSTQLQFAGQLIAPLSAEKTWDDLAAWADANPDGFCLFYTTNPRRQQVMGSVLSRQYKNGWLVLCSARDFAAGYRDWLSMATE